MVTVHTLEQGREAVGRHDRADAYAQLSATDWVSPLGPQDLERLAKAAELMGRDAHVADL